MIVPLARTTFGWNNALVKFLFSRMRIYDNRIVLKDIQVRVDGRCVQLTSYS